MTSSNYDIRRNLIDGPSVDGGALPPPAVTVSVATTGSASMDFRLGTSAYNGLQSAKSQDSLSIKYRRMKCAVVVMATLMIIASMLLVGVSLAMAEHIDELVRQMNNLGSTPRPHLTTPTAISKRQPENDVRDS